MKRLLSNICTMCDKEIRVGDECKVHPLGYTCKACWLKWQLTFVDDSMRNPDNIQWEIYGADELTEIIELITKLNGAPAQIFINDQILKSVVIKDEVLILSSKDWEKLITFEGIDALPGWEKTIGVIGHMYGSKVSNDPKEFKEVIQCVLSDVFGEILAEIREKPFEYETPTYKLSVRHRTVLGWGLSDHKYDNDFKDSARYFMPSLPANENAKIEEDEEDKDNG